MPEMLPQPAETVSLLTTQSEENSTAWSHVASMLLRYAFAMAIRRISAAPVSAGERFRYWRLPVRDTVVSVTFARWHLIGRYSIVWWPWPAVSIWPLSANSYCRRPLTAALRQLEETPIYP